MYVWAPVLFGYYGSEGVRFMDINFRRSSHDTTSKTAGSSWAAAAITSTKGPHESDLRRILETEKLASSMCFVRCSYWIDRPFSHCSVSLGCPRFSSFTRNTRPQLGQKNTSVPCSCGDIAVRRHARSLRRSLDRQLLQKHGTWGSN